MTLWLGSGEVRALATPECLMAAARAALDAEGHCRVTSPRPQNVDLPTGCMQVVSGAMGSVMGLKVTTLVHDVGSRQLLLLYRQPTGELIGVLDASEITSMWRAATTALAGEMLCRGGVSRLGLVGTGAEAESHLRLFSKLWRLETVSVYGPNRERRNQFARCMSNELGLEVRPAPSAVEAVRCAPMSLLATRAPEPVVDGRAFPPGAVVLSIGSTRPDSRELDAVALRRAGTLLVDDARRVAVESGDVIEALASGLLDPNHILSMFIVNARLGRVRRGSDRDLLIYKSVGTSVHDLALAHALVEEAQREGFGRDLGELTRLKAEAPNSQRLPRLTRVR